ncbi:MAG: hypothetical protein FD130_754 [Halothiobacillaceae bacterium]|nr:MAG: hypothetical protein FD130_754 [Halothiobacillaceae bacterium]
MAHIVKIGNSQGIRIPKLLIEQAHLEGKELKLQVVGDGLLISPDKGVREGWREAIAHSLRVHGHEALDEDWANPALDSDDEIEW